MSFLGGGAPTPPPPPLPDPLPTTPTFASGGARPAGNTNKIAGFGSTLMTSPMGADGSNTNIARKSLLGQ